MATIDLAPAPDPYGCGSNTLAALSLAIALVGEADATASITASPPLIRGGLMATAGGAASSTPRLSAVLQLASSTAAGANTAATLSGGTLAPPPPQIASLTGQADSLTTVKPANMRVQSIFTGWSAGQATAAATVSALAQLKGASGDGWQRPQIAASSAGHASCSAAITIKGVPTVSLAAG